VKVVVFAPDLGDRSRIEAAAPGAVVARAAAGLPALAAGADVVVLDLVRPGVLEVLADIVAAAARVVGYAPHVEGDLIAAAEAAGADVLPRSAFFRDVAGAIHG
jgi:hypothetical protein